PDVIRTDFKRKLRYPAVDRRTVVKEPALIEDNKLNQRLSARACAWLRRVVRLNKLLNSYCISRMRRICRSRSTC
ncbi:MAG TPA: hypothetical protein VKB53_02560, partial [Gammaproteobacteria bacterium]|nr:hypothetical protein [Gammaproteobacteria bacterium]